MAGALKVRVATDPDVWTTIGGGSFATEVETVAGELDDRAVTPAGLAAKTDRSIVNALDHGIAGDGTDETTAIQAMLTEFAGQRIYFPAPPTSYKVTDSLVVGDGTEIFGVGYDTVFDQAGNMERLFNLHGSDGCIVRDLRGIYTGGTANGSVSANGGAAFATNAMVWTNGNHHRFLRLIAEDFSVPVRIDNWDGTARTSRPTDNLVSDLTAYRPWSALLISGAMYSTFRNIKAFDVGANGDFGGTPPHCVYLTNEGSLTTPYMEGLHFDDLFCDGCPSYAFQFKAMLGGTVSNVEAVDCLGLISLLVCSDVVVDGAVGRNLTGHATTGAIYIDPTGGVANRLTLRNVDMRFVASPGIVANIALRIIANDIAFDGLYCNFPADAAAAYTILCGTSTTTSNYRFNNVVLVNSGSGLGAPLGMVNVTTMRGDIKATGYTNSASGVTTSSDVYVTVNNSAYTTALQPSAANAGVGAMIYDTTLSRPQWSNGTAWADAGVTSAASPWSGAGPSLFGRTGDYWGAPVLKATGALLSGQMYTFAVFVPYTVTIDRIGAEITTLAVGSTLSLGIYEDSGTGVPGTLLLDAGTIDGGVVAAAEKTVSQVLQAGRVYHLAALCQGGTPTVRVCSGSWVGFNTSLANAVGAGTRSGRSRGSVVGTALPVAGLMGPSSNVVSVGVRIA